MRPNWGSWAIEAMRDLDFIAVRAHNNHTMACSQNNYTCYSGGCGTAAASPDTPTTDGPMLVVSNCPETTTSVSMRVSDGGPTTDTMYRCEIDLPAGTKRIRVFVWHANQMGGTRVFSLFGRLASGSGQVQDRRIVSLRSTNYPPTGLCLAKVHLWSEWDAAVGDLSLGQTEVAIWQQTGVSNNQLVGAVMEFDVVLSGSATLRLRTTVASGPDAPGSWNQTPAFDPGAHVRGYWPFSRLTMAAGAFDAKALQGDPPIRIIQCVAAGGPELTAFAQTSGDNYGTIRGNRGCYGADLRYDFSVINTGDQTYPMFAYAQGRNVGSQGNGYFGPCSILSPGSYGKRGITKLRCDGASPQPGDYVRLTTTDGANEVAAQIQNGAQLTYRVGAAVAGAAATPFNLILRGLAYTLSVPPES